LLTDFAAGVATTTSAAELVDVFFDFCGFEGMIVTAPSGCLLSFTLVFFPVFQDLLLLYQTDRGLR
jgi:hypothetical protein